MLVVHQGATPLQSSARAAWPRQCPRFRSAQAVRRCSIPVMVRELLEYIALLPELTRPLERDEQRTPLAS
jgi:hypothetical protein